MNIYHKIINETAAHYTEKNRCLRDMAGRTQCAYSDGKGGRCALGRYIKDEFIGNVAEWEKERLGNSRQTAADNLFDHYPFDILKEEYRVEDVEFWVKLQRIHDNIDCWDAFGSTQIGKGQLDKLKSEYL